MKLADWLAIRNPDGTRKLRSKFAADIGVTPTMITAYCEGRMWPGRERMQEIVRVTKGAVTANDFLHEQSREIAS
jgi:DNA-binding transcriptional regulator YdaS (Cro superfamily)